MKPGRILGTGLLVLTAGLMINLNSTGADARPRAETQAFMRMKLAWSQATLEGITLEKFDVVSRNAIRLRDMTQSNHWFTMKQPDYMRHTTNFQKSAEGLYMAAVDKNLEAATEAYVKMAKSCVECHRLVRTEQRKSASLPDKARNDLGFRPVLAP